MSHLEEQARKSFKQHHQSVNDFQRAVQNMDNPTDVEESLARQGIMRDQKLAFLTISAWVRNSDDTNLNDIHIN